MITKCTQNSCVILMEQLPGYVARNETVTFTPSQLYRPYMIVQHEEKEEGKQGKQAPRSIYPYRHGEGPGSELDIDARSDTSYVIVDNYVPRAYNPNAERSLMVDNAGGQSEISEAHSINHIMQEVQATTCVLENEVKYFPKFKMIDYIVGIPNSMQEVTRVGVSVTRAMCAPHLQYTREDGVKLLKKKLNGLVVSRSTVCAEHSFYQSILHIFVHNLDMAEMLVEIIRSNEFRFDDLEITGTLDILITITDYAPIYTNENDCTKRQSSPLPSLYPGELPAGDAGEEF